MTCVSIIHIVPSTPRHPLGNHAFKRQEHHKPPTAHAATSKYYEGETHFMCYREATQQKKKSKRAEMDIANIKKQEQEERRKLPVAIAQNAR